MPTMFEVNQRAITIKAGCEGCLQQCGITLSGTNGDDFNLPKTIESAPLVIDKTRVLVEAYLDYGKFVPTGRVKLTETTHSEWHPEFADVCTPGQNCGYPEGIPLSLGGLMAAATAYVEAKPHITLEQFLVVGGR